MTGINFGSITVKVEEVQDTSGLTIADSDLVDDIRNLQSGTSSLQTQIDNIDMSGGGGGGTSNIRSFNISQSAGDYSATDNTVYFTSFYAQTSSEYNRVRVYTTINTSNFSGRVGVCIFSDSNQAPDSRLAYGESSVQSNISGLQEIVITISDFSSTKNTKYWLGISTDTASGTLYLQKFAYAYTSGEFLRKKASFYTAGGSPPFSASVSNTINANVLYYFEIYNPNILEITADTANYLNLDETSSQTINGPITLEDDISLSTNSKIQLGTSYGTSGQVLTSGGSSGSLTWTTPSGGGGSSSITPYIFITKNNDQTITSASAAFTDRLVFNTVDITSSGSGAITLDTSTGRITINETGVYKLDAMISCDATAGNRVVGSAQLRKNGTYVAPYECYAYCRQSTNGENTASLTGILSLSSSDYLEIYIARSNTSGIKIITKGTGISLMKIA